MRPGLCTTHSERRGLTKILSRKVSKRGAYEKYNEFNTAKVRQRENRGLLDCEIAGYQQAKPIIEMTMHEA